MKFGWSAALFLTTLLSFACKPTVTTDGPAASGNKTQKSDNAVGKDPLVSKSSDVPLDQVPRLTVEIDVTDCVGGTGKWYDPATPATSRTGAISLAPTKTGDNPAGQQPAPFVFEPVKESEVSAPVSKGSQPWRLEKGTYSIEAIAYNAKSASIESKVNKSFDFASTNDLTLSLVGTWKDSNCTLEWK